jgi:K+/H+ antiporter YhaU regulatory subunit KhtT
MSIVLLIIFIGISFFIVRAGAIAFKMTGMGWQQAKFQALSAFSGTGFTTKEAESVVNHPQRRKITTWLMILGNAGIVSVIATFVVSMRGGGVMRTSLTLIVAIVTIFLLLKIAARREFMKKLTQKIEQKLAEKTDLRQVSIEEIIEQAKGYGVTRILIDEHFCDLGKTLIDAQLKERDILVLSIERGEEIIPNPKATMKIKLGDTLTCFGKLEEMRKLIREKEYDESLSQ